MAHDDEDVLEMYWKSCSMVLVLQGNFNSRLGRTEKSLDLLA
jgi:hypothetical protein